MEFTKQNILFCPLDWGLGHASRSVPLIRHYIQQGSNVYIATSGHALAFLKIEFPNLTFFELPSYAIKYGKNNGALKLAFRFFNFANIVRSEHAQIEKLVDKLAIDLIVSDNRYGAYSAKAKSVFVTHQLSIQLPYYMRFVEFIPNKIQKLLLSKFNEIWVPDFENEFSLSGNLTKSKSYQNCKFIGWQSRFVPSKTKVAPNGILAWVSGPEPQRSVFAAKLKEQLMKVNIPATLVIGNPNEIENQEIGNLRIINHLSSIEFNELICKSEWIICRAGYSSLMDLAVLQKSALIVPCKGQSEQEYLASFCHKNGYFLAQQEDSLNILEAITHLKNFHPPK